MSDQQDGRPLTRRELRLRQLAEAGIVDPAESVPTAPEAAPIIPGGEAPTGPIDRVSPDDDIVIAPFDEQGRLRSRREIRLLREQELAKRAQADLDDAVKSVEATEGSVEAANVSPAPAAVVETADAPTEPAAVVEAEIAEVESPTVVDVDAAEIHAESGDAAETVVSGAVSGAETARMEVVAEPEEPAVPAAPVSAAASSETYSFPDIAPLDETESVFDDPTVRTVPGAGDRAANGEPDGAFDDLISRAIAEEGPASPLGTSALILPTMPAGADLSGPLGETGEVYITGSIELPRSLGETGGHSALLDSVEGDPLDELTFGERRASDPGIAPVSAASAVSARGPGLGVTEAPKEKSKLPVVLIATGGGLVLVVVGLVVWGSVSGMFG